MFQEQGGGRVAEVVEADVSEPGPVEETAEAAGGVGRVERSFDRRGEDEALSLQSSSAVLHTLHGMAVSG